MAELKTWPLRAWTLFIDNNNRPATEFQGDKAHVEHSQGASTFGIEFDLPIVPDKIIFNGVEYVKKAND